MELFAALIWMIFGKLKRQAGNESNKLFEMSAVSSWLHLDTSSGRVDNLLKDKFKSVIKLNLEGSLGGIFLMTFDERLQAVTSIFLSSIIK